MALSHWREDAVRYERCWDLRGGAVWLGWAARSRVAAPAARGADGLRGAR